MNASSGAGEVRFQFVPPPMEGTLSLGVYGGGGKLVRVLRRAAAPAEFKAGLNGLHAAWDGTDDAGAPAAEGTYRVRGVMVGDLRVEGEAFAGNDWIVEESSPRFRAVEAVALRADGGLAMLVALPDGNRAYAVTGPDGVIRRFQPLPEGGGPALIASGGGSDYVASGGNVVRFTDPAAEGDGASWQVDGAAGALDALAADAGSVACVAGGRLRLFGPAGGVPLADAAADGVEAVAVRGGRVVAVVRGALSQREGESWRPMPLPELGKATAVAFGVGETVWVVDGAERGEVKQYGLDGSFLRRLGAVAGEPQPVSVAADPAREVVALLERSPGMNRVRVMRLVSARAGEGPGAQATSTWSVELSKAIRATDSAESGLALFPDMAARDPLRVKLRHEPLDPRVKAAVAVRCHATPEGALLTLADGLPLRLLTETGRLRWALLAVGGDGEVRLLQGDGATVEVFSVAGLGDMMTFDAGEVQWPEAPPEREPE